jgi:DNA-binding protein YbaB
MTTDPNRMPPLQIEEVSETLRRFAEGSRTSFEATSDDLVSVRVGTSMNVLAIEFLDPRLDAHLKEPLEAATVAAVNAALQKAALAAGRALAELQQKVRIGDADPASPDTPRGEEGKNSSSGE